MADVLVEPRPATRAARTPAVRPGVTVIVPCFNEEKMIGATVRQLADALEADERAFELVVVDDGSHDDSRDELAALGRTGGVRVLRNARNRGYGYSIKRAARAARFDLIAITDADGTYPNHRIAEMVDRIDGADMIVGARVGQDVHVPWLRRPAKWILRRLACYLTDTTIPDLNSGFRVMKRSLVLRFLPILPDGFSFTTTITLALLTHGYDVQYVPINYNRRVGRSTIRPLHDTLNFLGLIVRTVMYFKPLRIFAPTSGLLALAAVTVGVVSKLAFGRLADVTAVTLMLAAVQMLAIGLLADLIDKRVPLTGASSRPEEAA